MRQLVILFAVIACSIPGLHCMPLGYTGRSQTLYIGSDNVLSLASFVDDSITIQGRAIVFGTGAGREKLLEVPLGFIDPHATIRLTIGLDDTVPSAPAIDHDPDIGISDGSTANMFRIHDTSNYGSYSPCTPLGVTSEDDNRVTERAHASGQITMIFRPIHKFGFCYLPMNGGYINTATFANQLDVSRSLSLLVRREDSGEQYRFYYFIVEVL